MEKNSFLTRHRSLFMVVLMTSALLVSSVVNQRRLEEDAQTVSLPVTSAVSVFQAEHADAYMTDVAALHAVSINGTLDTATREAAAQRLTQLTADREAEAALDRLLATSSLAPCAAVVSGGSVTIVTEKAAVTQEETALVLTLAAAHAGAAPESVHIMTASTPMP